MEEKRLITAALPYINNIPHLGHIVGSHLPADIFARFCRAKGYETFFVGGTDENGSTSEIAAKQIGVDIKTFSDKLYAEHKKIYEWFNISYDNFSRTSKPIHHETTKSFFKEVYKNGYITKGKTKVFYSPKEKRFLPDRYVKGICAKCGYEEANADQCEKCTSVLETSELLNPKSALSGSSVEIREVEHLFLRLDKLSDSLEKWLKKQRHWRKQVTGLAFGWINEGLRERCITRDLEHGVRVPLKGFKHKVFYVWFDAPIGYISSTKEATRKWKLFWHDKKAKIFHFLGKDNIPFHTIFWPAMLMAHGKINLPYYVEGLQYLNYEGGKFSKSKKRGVFCEKLRLTGIDPDIVRSYLIFVLPEAKDSEFKWVDFQNRVNAEIIGNFGNFVNRSLHFIYTRLGNRIEKPSKHESTKEDKEFIGIIKKKVKKIDDYLERVQLRNAFLEILTLSAEGNKYFNDREPWITVKKDIKRTRNILYLCADLCRVLSILLSPYVPGASQKTWEQLNLKGKVNKSGIWNDILKSSLPAEHAVNKPSIIFNKITNEYLADLKQQTSDTSDIKEMFRK